MFELNTKSKQSRFVDFVFSPEDQEVTLLEHDKN